MTQTLLARRGTVRGLAVSVPGCLKSSRVPDDMEQ